MVWAIESMNPVFIPQAWLSKEWEKIHGAKIVYIKRVRTNEWSLKCVSRYLVSQYLAGGQSEIVRCSWSWWRARFAIGEGWETFKRESSRGRMERRFNPKVRFKIPFKELIRGWEEILARGRALVGGRLFVLLDRSVVCMGMPENDSSTELAEGRAERSERPAHSPYERKLR